MRAGTRLGHGAHLVRRFAGSLSPLAPSPEDEAWARSFLFPAEVELWRRMSNQDRRHAIQVARRLSTFFAPADRPELAGALLHDVGKADAGLGTLARVAATLVPARIARGRFATYRRHEAIGAEWCRAAGSRPVTIALVAGEDGSAASRALREADDL